MNSKNRTNYITGAGLSMILLISCGKMEKKPSSPPGISRDRSQIAFPVEVQPVEMRRVTFTLEAVGSVEAFEIVQITSRVPGVVETIRFSEGALVQSGQVLVEIELDRYRLAVEAAQAAFEKAAASKADAEAGLHRREEVVQQNPGLIPQEEIETWKTRVLSATADLTQSSASLNQAKLNLRDAYIRAPVAGMIETRTVQTGQYVNPGTVLATLVRRDPLLVRFQVPESEASRLKKNMPIFFRVSHQNRSYRGELIHVSASADENTRMVSLTAKVTDPLKHELRAGAFAQITIPIGSEKEVPVIPQTAIRPTEKGFIAFIVEDEKVHERILSLGMRTLDGKVEVVTGLKQGESLVIRGAEALKEGYTIRVIQPKSPPDSKPKSQGEMRP